MFEDVSCGWQRLSGPVIRPALARRVLLCCLATWLASGCGGPLLRADDIASGAGFTKNAVHGTRFTHLAYIAEGPDPQSPVWVYIEGDGIPWIGETIPSVDPTPRTLVALSLMVKGPRPAVFLGRPCYFGTAARAPCEPVWWTHRRFSEDVIASMVAAFRQLAADRGWGGRRINLVGFSGGGTLATLMAARLAGVCALITVASPLDIDEWAASRGYSPLVGSVNPARLPALRDTVRQLHLRGERDPIVAPGNGGEFRRRNPAAQFRVVANVDHGMAWVATWDVLFGDKSGTAIGGCP